MVAGHKKGASTSLPHTQNLASAIGRWGQEEICWCPAPPRQTAFPLLAVAQGSPVLCAVPVWRGVSASLSWEGRGREWLLIQIPQTLTVLTEFYIFWGVVCRARHAVMPELELSISCFNRLTENAQKSKIMLKFSSLCFILHNLINLAPPGKHYPCILNDHHNVRYLVNCQAPWLA